MRIRNLIALAAASVAAVLPASAAVTFTATGVLNIYPTSISDDGQTVVGVGNFGSGNFYWTEAGGLQLIGDGCPSGQMAISGDGSTVVGCNTDPLGSWNTALWLGGTSWQDLGSVAGANPCDVFLSGPWDLTQDGSKAVGLVWLASTCDASGGVWDLVAGGPATELPNHFGTNRASRANAVSADGSVIAGWQDNVFGLRGAAMWVNGVETKLTTNSGDFLGEALEVSPDGKTAVGLNYNFTRAGWIWHEGTGVTKIEGKADGDYTAVDVTGDGRLAIGNILIDHGGFFELQAFLWRQKRGVTLLEDFLRINGASPPAGWELDSASVITPDGSRLIGWGFNPDGVQEMFVIDISGPGTKWGHGRRAGR